MSDELQPSCSESSFFSGTDVDRIGQFGRAVACGTIANDRLQPVPDHVSLAVRILSGLSTHSDISPLESTGCEEPARWYTPQITEQLFDLVCTERFKAYQRRALKIV